MKKNVIMSTVAATVVTGVLLLSGCNSSNGGTKYDAGHKAEGKVEISFGTDGSVKEGLTASAKEKDGGNLGGGFSTTQVTVKEVRCVDTNDQPAPCSTTCTPAAPCDVTVAAACSNATDSTAALDYTKRSDIVGAWDAYDTTDNAAVAAVRGDATLVPAYSGVVTVSTTGIDACDFDFSTFVVCALTNDGTHAWNTSTNSAGYVLVLVEYGDGTKEWKKVNITRKSNGVENDQPFISANFSGRTPAKITVFSVLKKGTPATGAQSTGASSLL